MIPGPLVSRTNCPFLNGSLAPYLPLALLLRSLPTNAGCSRESPNIDVEDIDLEPTFTVDTRLK